MQLIESRKLHYNYYINHFISTESMAHQYTRGEGMLIPPEAQSKESQGKLKTVLEKVKKTAEDQREKEADALLDRLIAKTGGIDKVQKKLDARRAGSGEEQKRELHILSADQSNELVQKEQIIFKTSFLYYPFFDERGRFILGHGLDLDDKQRSEVECVPLCPEDVGQYAIMGQRVNDIDKRLEVLLAKGVIERVGGEIIEEPAGELLLATQRPFREEINYDHATEDEINRLSEERHNLSQKMEKLTITALVLPEYRDLFKKVEPYKSYKPFGKKYREGESYNTPEDAKRAQDIIRCTKARDAYFKILDIGDKTLKMREKMRILERELDFQ